MKLGVSLIICLFVGVHCVSWSDTGLSCTWTSSFSDASGSLLLGTCSLGGFVYYSEDFGITFNTVNEIPAGGENWFGISTSQNGTLSACVSNGGGGQGNMYICQGDYCFESSSAPTNEYWANVDISSTGQYIIAPANLNGVVYLSTDYGSSFNPIQDLDNLDYNWAIVSSTGEYMYAVVGGAQGGTGSIYASSDFGATWHVTTAPSNVAWFQITCDDSGQKLVAVTYGEGIYYSLNAGQDWLISSGVPNTEWHGVASSSSGVYVAAVVYGSSDCSEALYISNNYGQNFYLAESPVADTCWWTVSMNADASIVMVGANYGNLYVGNGLFDSLPTPGPSVPAPTTKPTVTPTYFPTFATDTSIISWTTVTGLPAYEWVEAGMDSSGTYMAVTARGQSDCVWVSTDSGKHWVGVVDIKCNTADDSSDLYDVIMSSTGQYMVAFSEGGEVYTSSDYGTKWTAGVAPTVTWYMSMSSNGQYVYGIAFDSADHIYQSTDYGQLFQPLSGSPSAQWVDVAVCGSNVYAISYDDALGGMIYKSADSGNSWSMVSNENDWVEVVCDINNNGLTLFATAFTSEGDNFFAFFSSNDGGSSWSPVSTPESVILDGVSGNTDLTVMGSIGFNNVDDDVNDEGFYLTEDFGKTWVLTSAPSYAEMGAYAFNGAGSTVLLTLSSDGVLIGAVAGTDNNANSLSSGAVAGIVISVLVVVVAAGSAFYFKQSISAFLFGTSATGLTQPLAAGSGGATQPAAAAAPARVSITPAATQNPINNDVQRTMSAEQHAAGFNSEL